jgi:CRP/FNR family transcriptional regulator
MRGLTDHQVTDYASDTCSDCAIRSHSICAALDSSEVGTLRKIGRHRKLKAGEPLIWEGDESHLVANVLAGMLKLVSSTADGREQVVGIVYPTDFIGRPFGSTSHHSVTAISDAIVCLFPRGDFDHFASEHPALEHKLLQRTLGELDRTRKWMTLLSRNSAMEKVAIFMLDMSRRLPGARPVSSSEIGATEFDLPFGRSVIADVLGLSTETVCRQLTTLKRKGVLEFATRRRVRIVQVEELSRIGGEGFGSSLLATTDSCRAF